MSDFKKLCNAIDILNDLHRFLQIPADDSKSLTLTQLVDLREKLGIPDRVKNNLNEGIITFSSKVAGENRRHQLEDFLAELLKWLDKEMTRLWRSGQRDSRYIFSGDFTRPLRQIRIELANLQEDYLYAAMLEDYEGPSLTPPPGGWYLINDRPAIILGMSESLITGEKLPRSYYRLEDSLRLTASFRTKQAEEESEQQYRQRLEEAQKKRDFEASEIGKALALQKKIERLKAQGKLPPEYADA